MNGLERLAEQWCRIQKPVTKLQCFVLLTLFSGYPLKFGRKTCGAWVQFSDAVYVCFK